MRILVGKFADIGLVRAQDELGDRLDRLRAPRFDVDQRIMVLDAGDRHDAGEFAVAGRDVVRDARLILDVHRSDVAAQLEERRDLLPLSVVKVRRQSTSAEARV